MENLQSLIEKIEETIRRDVNNIFIRAGGTTKLAIEDQDALIRYHKLLTDAKLQAKEKDLDEKIKRAEEALSRGKASGA